MVQSVAFIDGNGFGCVLTRRKLIAARHMGRAVDVHIERRIVFSEGAVRIEDIAADLCAAHRADVAYGHGITIRPERCNIECYRRRKVVGVNRYGLSAVLFDRPLVTAGNRAVYSNILRACLTDRTGRSGDGRANLSGAVHINH
ncbi:hypothetical protein SDC9_162633 [bioreactor metagenome]|uniref:Uncharacterized protein n=1 Tax=bioreactor metagenome TaxID=1076179 RepID=A0A645FT91_9ZZZZ